MESEAEEALDFAGWFLWGPDYCCLRHGLPMVKEV